MLPTERNELWLIHSILIELYLDLCNIFKLHGLKFKKIKKNSADVFKTHGDNSKIKKNMKNLKFSNQINAIKKTFEWYKKYKIYEY